MKGLRYLLIPIILLAIASAGLCQGGTDVHARILFVGAKIVTYPFLSPNFQGPIDAEYNGPLADAFKVNYTGTGHYPFRIQISGVDKFTVAETGNVSISGDLTVGGSIDGSVSYGEMYENLYDHGAAGNGTTDDYDEIQAAITAAQADDSTVVIPIGTFKIATNLTFPSDISVYVVSGGILKPANGIKVTFSGNVQAGAYKWLDTSATGSFEFSNGFCPTVMIEWWGGKGDDSTDNHDAFEKAITAMPGGGRIKILTGRYHVSEELDNFPADYSYKAAYGYTIEGESRNKSTLVYTGESGFLFHIEKEDQTSAVTVDYITIRDLTIEADNLTAEGGGILYAGASHCIFENITFRQMSPTYATCIYGRNSKYTVVESSQTHDANKDFTGDSIKYAIRWQAPRAGRVRGVVVRLGKTNGGGEPNGSLYAATYSESGGVPNAQVGGVSDAVDPTTLSTAADGGDVRFDWSDWDYCPEVSGSTYYWTVLYTSGHTNYADGSIEIRLRVDTGNKAGYFATYTGSWASGNDGSNNSVDLRCISGIYNFAINCTMERGVSGDSDRALYGFQIYDAAHIEIWGCNVLTENGIKSEGGNHIAVYGGEFSHTNAGIAFDLDGGQSRWVNTHIEGMAKTKWGRTGKGYHRFAFCHMGGYYDVKGPYDTPAEFISCNGPLILADDATIYPFRQVKQIVGASHPDWEFIAGTTKGTDADALNNDTAIQLDASGDQARFNYNGGASGATHYAKLPRGIYRVHFYLKDSAGSAADDCEISFGDWDVSPTSHVVAWIPELTSSYQRYTINMDVNSADLGDGMYFKVRKRTATSNTISVSHVIVEYMGPDTPSGRYDLIASNSVASDADGARASSVVFQGLMTANPTYPEESTLAEIRASHHGSSKDEKGKVEILVNDTDDGFSPTVALTIDSSLKTTLAGIMKLPVRTSAPGSAAQGDVAIADRANWDPCSIGSGGAYIVWYDGDSWERIDTQGN